MTADIYQSYGSYHIGDDVAGIEDVSGTKCIFRAPGEWGKSVAIDIWSCGTVDSGYSQGSSNWDDTTTWTINDGYYVSGLAGCTATSYRM
jgi:hypothetical protein